MYVHMCTYVHVYICVHMYICVCTYNVCTLLHIMSQVNVLAMMLTGQYSSLALISKSYPLLFPFNITPDLQLRPWHSRIKIDFPVCLLVDVNVTSFWPTKIEVLCATHRKCMNGKWYTLLLVDWNTDVMVGVWATILSPEVEISCWKMTEEQCKRSLEPWFMGLPWIAHLQMSFMSKGNRLLFF